MFSLLIDQITASDSVLSIPGYRLLQIEEATASGCKNVRRDAYSRKTAGVTLMSKSAWMTDALGDRRPWAQRRVVESSESRPVQRIR